MKLPDKKYLTFEELTERWECTMSDLLHLVVTGKIIPSMFFSGMFEVIYSGYLELPGRIAGDPPQKVGGVTERVLCNDFLPLRSREVTGPNQCGFGIAVYSDTTHTSKNYPQLECDGIILDKAVHSDRLTKEGVFMQEEILRCEREHVKRDAPNDSLSGWQGFDPDDRTYPEELDIALQAWWAVRNNPGSGSAKDQIKAWLKQHYGKLKDAPIERIATVCNWNKDGGRPKSD